MFDWLIRSIAIVGLYFIFRWIIKDLIKESINESYKISKIESSVDQINNSLSEIKNDLIRIKNLLNANYKPVTGEELFQKIKDIVDAPDIDNQTKSK